MSNALIHKGDIYFDGKLLYVFLNSKWEIIEGQKWCDPDTNKVYTWVKDRWVEATDLLRGRG